MTKKLSKPCIRCTHYSGGIPCSMGHKPRLFVNGGLRRVCEDFDLRPNKPSAYGSHRWIDSFMKIFGFRRA